MSAIWMRDGKILANYNRTIFYTEKCCCSQKCGSYCSTPIPATIKVNFSGVVDVLDGFDPVCNVGEYNFWNTTDFILTTLSTTEAPCQYLLDGTWDCGGTTYDWDLQVLAALEGFVVNIYTDFGHYPSPQGLAIFLKTADNPRNCLTEIYGGAGEYNLTYTDQQQVNFSGATCTVSQP